MKYMYTSRFRDKRVKDPGAITPAPGIAQDMTMLMRTVYLPVYLFERVRSFEEVLSLSPDYPSFSFPTRLSRFDMGRHCRKDVNSELEIICYTFYDRRHITIINTKCLVKDLGAAQALQDSRPRKEYFGAGVQTSGS
jgi:hypothetical protein